MNNSETDITINEISGNDGSVGVFYIQEQEENRTRRSTQYWTEEETKYLLQLYEENVKKVGPSKRFRIKKTMWMHIAPIMTEKFGRDITAAQAENRYKSEKRKNKRNRNLVLPRIVESSYDHKLENPVDMDDSILPEVMRGRTSVRKTEFSSDDYYNSNQIPCTSSSPPFLFGENNEQIILKYMQQQQEIFKEKEERKQKRHDEKIIVLKGIGESLQRLLERKKKYNN